MATNYVETEVEDDDTELAVLETLAGPGRPFAFIVVTFDASGDMDLKVSPGGGIRDAATLRALLEKTLAALPPE
ncbi:MAG: hypothetical protein REI11_20985 [Patulibacter sp.]|nr:hypothetical protein [Patulibacter sp.]